MSAAPAGYDPGEPLPADLLDAWLAAPRPAPLTPPRPLAAAPPSRPVECRLTVARRQSGDTRGATLADWAIALFVTPRPMPVAGEPAAAGTRFAPRVVVLGTPQEAPPVAAALANAFRRRERSGAAVVLTWPASPATRRPAAPAAARLAARLAARDVPAVPRGRLAWIALEEPSAETARRLAGALDEPLVLAPSGARTDAVDALLEEQDLVAVVTRDPGGPLARLALASITVPAIALPPLTGAARRLALAGLGGGRAVAKEALA